MAYARIQVDGLREVNAELRKIKDTETPKAIRVANKAAAHIVAVHAAALAPKRTGRLAKSLKERATAKSAAAIAGSAVRVPYAPAINWGVGPRTGQKGPHSIKPSLFMQRAADETHDEVVDAYRDALQEIGL